MPGAILTIVVGEGAKDQAPMLFDGEQLGAEGGIEFDIAVAPLECTTLRAKGRPGAEARRRGAGGRERRAQPPTGLRARRTRAGGSRFVATGVSGGGLLGRPWHHHGRIQTDSIVIAAGSVRQVVESHVWPQVTA